jgi:hypothetical protein
LEVGITGHNIGRGPSKDHSTKVLLQLAQWFLRRRFKKNSPLKLLSQSQPNFAEMILGWSPSKVISGISIFLEENHPMTISSTFSSY